MYYLRARYYNPTTARFISADSYWGDVRNPASLNLYTYCHNDPVNFTDPSGHNPRVVTDVQTKTSDDGKWVTVTTTTASGTKYTTTVSASNYSGGGVVFNGTGNAHTTGLNVGDVIGGGGKVVGNVGSGYGGVMAAGGGVAAPDGISDTTRNNVINQIAADKEISFADAETLYNNDLQNGTLTNDPNGTFSYLTAEGVILREVYMFVGDKQIETVTFENDRDYGGLREMVDILEGEGNVEFDPETGIATFRITNRNLNPSDPDYIKEYTFDLSTYDSQTDKERGYILRDGRIMVGLRWLAERAGLVDTLSWWNENDGKTSYAMIQPDMKFSPVKVTRAGDDVSIKIYRKYSGPQADAEVPGGGTYSELADEGFMGWAGDYDMGTDAKGNSIVVKTTVKLFDEFDESDISKDPLKQQRFTDVRITSVQDDVDADVHLEPTFGPLIGRGYTWWAGHGSSYDRMVLYTDYPNIDADGNIILDESGNASIMLVRSRGEFINLSTHELGHRLGVGDGYDTGWHPQASASIGPNGDIMVNNWLLTAAPTNLHMVMIFNSFKYRAQQEYADYEEGEKYANQVPNTVNLIR